MFTFTLIDMWSSMWPMGVRNEHRHHGERSGVMGMVVCD